MLQRSDSIIINVVCSIMVPFIQIFGIYVVFFAHYGAGGGFQGGVILAVGIILQRLYLGPEASYRKFPAQTALVLAGGGMLAYVLAGLVPVFLGGAFLDYAYFPIPGLSGASLRYISVYVIEVFIAAGVFGTLVLMFDVIAGGSE